MEVVHRAKGMEEGAQSFMLFPGVLWPQHQIHVHTNLEAIEILFFFGYYGGFITYIDMIY